EAEIIDTIPAAAAPAIDSGRIMAGPFGAAYSGSNTPVILENEKLRVEINPKGGRISSVELKDFKTYTGDPLIMFSGAGNRFGLELEGNGKNISTDDLYFTPSANNIAVNQTDSAYLTMRLTYAEGKYIDYVYSLKGDSYNVGLAIATKGL